MTDLASGPLEASTGVLNGGGALGALMRSMDWSATPLGPVEGWPQSLRTAVGVLLATGFPMYLAWGPEYTQLYNDGYRPILGTTKHPAALGASTRDTFSEIWDFIGPMFEQVMTRGQATTREDQLLPLDRNGYVEECYFHFSYSAIPAEHGAVGGVLVTVAETTQRVLGERRLRTLRELGSQGSEARTTTDACVLAAETLARNPLDVPFALVYLLDDSGTRASLAAAVGLAAGTPASPEQIDLGSPDMPWPLAVVGSSRASVVVDTRSGVVDRLPGGPWPELVRQALVAPVAASTQQPLAGFLVAGASPRLALDTEYRGFLELVGSHVATAVYNARAYEEERRRAEALVELDRAKTTFFSNVSHEFRTPLTLLLGPIEDALTNAAEPLLPAQRERLDLAHRNGLRLLKLVNTLLDFSRIEAGRVEASYEPTDLAAVTADHASTFRSAVERAGLRLVVDAPLLPVPVYVDRDMWEKIVLNLLSNAFKFTFEGSITVALRGASDHVEVEVSDTGTGIPPGELPHLFERFHRIKGALGRTQEGTGIGLALVQELVRQHGGRVQVTSELGRGTSFTIHLPTGTAHLPPDKVSGATRALSSTALGAAPFIQEASRWLPDAAELAADGGLARAAPAADLGNSSPRVLGGFDIRGRDGGVPRVLLADDNADMREYVARLLGNRWRVHAVADGQAALEAVLENPPDLVLADVMMPRLDGFGLLRALRADPRTRALPVLLLSARAGEEASAEGLDAGADDYLTKPFTGRELLARVGAHLAMAAMRRETLERERDQLERVFELSPTFLAVLRGPDHVFDLVNPAYYQLAGHRDLIGKPVRAALPEIEGQRFFELLDEVHRTGQPFVGKELPVQLQRAPEAPLERRYVDFVYQPMQDPAGEVIGILVSGADVTDLVAAREEAQQLAGERDAERRRLLTVLEQSPLAIAIAEAPSGRLLFTNAKTGELLGGAAPMTAGGTYADLGPVSRDGEVLAPADHPLARALLRGQTVTSEVVEVEHSDGRRHELVANAAPVRDAEGRIIAAVVIFWDVTEERQTERQLRDAQRLQAVGTLAGGVAHEVNNQMTAVLGFGTFALRAIGPDHPQAEDLRRVLQAGERAAHITQQLLAFSRRQLTRPQVVDLQALAVELRPVLEHLLGSDKTLVIASRRAAGRVRVDPAQVEQVLINLVANARDATNTGGRVTIEVEDVEVVRDDPRAEHPRTIALGRYILLRVSDTGHGMTPETAARVFEPFFTTKAVGQGTGLGLSMVYGIVKQHGGEITLQSNLGRGTTMRLYWPTVAASAERAERGEGSDTGRPLAQRAATVLVVEDETTVRELTVRALQEAGLRVISAENGEKAFQMLEEKSLKPDVVITDVIMPEMNGRQLSDIIAARYPGVPVLFMSGYTGDDALVRRLVPPGAPFLQKPFTPDRLLAVVQRLSPTHDSGS